MLLVRFGKNHKYISLKAKRKIKMTGHDRACFDYMFEKDEIQRQLSHLKKGSSSN